MLTRISFSCNKYKRMVNRWIGKSVNRWIGSPLLLEQRERKEGWMRSRRGGESWISESVLPSYSSNARERRGGCAADGVVNRGSVNRFSPPTRATREKGGVDAQQTGWSFRSELNKNVAPQHNLYFLLDKPTSRSLTY